MGKRFRLQIQRATGGQRAGRAYRYYRTSRGLSHVTTLNTLRGRVATPCPPVELLY